MHRQLSDDSGEHGGDDREGGETASDREASGALRRRTILGACAAAATGIVGTVGGQSDSPVIEYADDGMSVRVAGDGVETVTLTTGDGSTFEFDGDSSWYGYTAATDEPIEGWHGTIEQTEVSTGSETVTRLNPHYRQDLEVGCSTYRSEADVADLRLDFEDATKHYDPPIADTAEFGSPGRALQQVTEMSNETRVTREGCSPSGSRAVSFDCTSVTVEPEEFVHESPVCHGVELTFADGSTQSLGDGHEPPVTFQGEGEHAGKVIETLGFSYDEYGAGWFEYENPDVGTCQPASGGGGSGNATGEGGSGNASDQSGSGSASGEGDGADGASTTQESDAGASTTEQGSSSEGGTSSEDAAPGGSGSTGDASGGSSSDSSGDDSSSDESSGASDPGSSDSTGDTSSGASGDSSDSSGGSTNSSEFDWRDLYSEW